MQGVGRVRGLARLLCCDEELQGISWLSSFGTYECSFDMAFGVDMGAVCLIKGAVTFLLSSGWHAQCAHTSVQYILQKLERVHNVSSYIVIFRTSPTDRRGAK